jgi:pyruvate,water dikinase
MGNYLSHGAIVARELGIPAVGNLYDATTRIMDGQMIEVDGNSGNVKLSKK